MPDAADDIDAERSKVLALRLALSRAGYLPIPLFGKAPPVYGKNNSKKGLGSWQKLVSISYEQIQMWGRTWPDAANTGVLTRLTPALDLDLLNEGAAVAAEGCVRERLWRRLLGYPGAMPVFFHDLDGGFTGWLDQAPATADAAGDLIRQMRGSVVISTLADDFASLDELRGFLMGMGAGPAAIATAGEVWRRYSVWRRQ